MVTTCIECIHNTFLIGRSMAVKLVKKKVACRLDLNFEWCSTQASHEIMRHFAWACFVPFPHQTHSSGSHVGPRPRNVHRPQMIPIYIEPRTLSLHF